MRFILIAIGLLTSVGCTTVEFVRKDLMPDKKAVLKYPTTDSDKKASKYQEKVQEKAMQFCGGGYEVEKQYQAREETGTSTGFGTGLGTTNAGVLVGTSRSNTAMYNFVEIACLGKNSAENSPQIE
jgi:hypothetical protein